MDVDAEVVPVLVVDAVVFVVDSDSGELTEAGPVVAFAVEPSSPVDCDDSDGEGFDGDESEPGVADATP